MTSKKFLPLSTEGMWWWPDKPTERFAGTITFDSKGGGVLRLVGETVRGRYVPKKWSFPMMRGQSMDSSQISLIYPWIAHQSSTSNGVFRIELKFDSAIFGAWIDDIDSPCVTEIAANFEGTNVWAKDTGFDVRLHKKRFDYTVRYKIPKARKISLEPGTCLRFYRDHSIPLGRDDDGGVHLTERLRLSIETRSPKPLSFFIKKLTSLRDFLSVGTLRFATPSEISLKCDFRKAKDTALKAQEKYSKLALKMVFNDPDDSHVSPFHCLFTEQAIAAHLDTVIQAWFKKEDLLEPALLLYNCAIYSDQFHESQFIFLSQSIETLHRYTRPGRYIDQAVYDTTVLPVLVAAIPSVLGPSFRDALTRRFTYGNQHSLRKRLQEVFGEHPVIMKTFRINPKAEASAIADARNALTHHEPSPDKAPRKRPDLHRMCMVLRLVIEASLLREMGLPDDLVSTLCTKNEFYLQRFMTMPPAP
jgi:hypothetical protein